MEILVLLIVVFFLWRLISSGTRSNDVQRPPRSRAPRQPSGSRDVTIKIAPPLSRGPPSIEEILRESRSCWIGPGNTVTLAGREIQGGMLYVGRRMRPPAHWVAVDPALINPNLPVASTLGHGGDQIPYWPSYLEISSRARADYLDWLAGGRRNPAAEIGHVFLFFYGLERRVLIDARHLPEAKAELGHIASEVDALVDVYGSHASFGAYASAFREYVRFCDPGFDVETLEPPTSRRGWDIPESMKVALGMMAADGRPIPAEWALAWYRQHRFTSLRTAARRCPKAFDQLFLLRYRKRHGAGMTLNENRKRLSLAYRPATAGIRDSIPFDLPRSLPDVTGLRGPLNRLNKVADGVYEELDGYSRWVGRHEDRESLAAIALLPRELAREWAGEQVDALREWVGECLSEDDFAVVEPTAVVRWWPSSKAGKLTRREAQLFAELLQHFGYGIEPDTRYTSRNFSTVNRAVLFRLPADQTAQPGARYEAATVLLHLGAAVAAADDEVAREEQRHLEEHLEAGLGLESGERLRLRAHLQWLLAAPPTLRGVRSRVEGLDEGVRRRLGGFLLAVAGADGHVSAEELDILSRIYPILGLDPDDLYRDAHALAARTPGGSEPVAVIPGESMAGHSVPRPVDGTTEFRLDPERLQQHLDDTNKVTKVLTRIFVDDGPAPNGSQESSAEAQARELLETNGWERKVTGQVEAAEAAAEDGEDPMLAGLDAAHSMLVRALAVRELWPAEDFRMLAEECRLMPAGAIEVVNEVAFGICDEPLLEGDDPVEVNVHALKELLG